MPKLLTPTLSVNRGVVGGPKLKNSTSPGREVNPTHESRYFEFKKYSVHSGKKIV